MPDLHLTKGLVYWMQWASKAMYGFDLPDVRSYEDFLILQTRMHIGTSVKEANVLLLKMWLKTLEDMDNKGAPVNNEMVWQVIEANIQHRDYPYFEWLEASGSRWPSDDDCIMLRVDRSWKSEPWRFGLPSGWKKEARDADYGLWLETLNDI